MSALRVAVLVGSLALLASCAVRSLELRAEPTGEFPIPWHEPNGARPTKIDRSGPSASPVVTVAQAPISEPAKPKARGLSLRAELFQGRLAMLGTAAVVLLAGPQHTVSEAVGDVVDAVVGTL